MLFGPWIIMRKDKEPFYKHFCKFWAKMPIEMKDAARLAAIHVKYRPKMKPRSGADKILAEISRQAEIHRKRPSDNELVARGILEGGGRQ